MKYIVYATTDHGQGYVQKVGEYDFVEEIDIHVGTFSDDVLITIETKNESLEKED